MPFTSYYNTRPDDVAALFTYFKYGFHRSGSESVKRHRVSLVDALAADVLAVVVRAQPKPFLMPSGMDAQLSQGAYFVEGWGNCGECHTPRALTMQVKATTPAGGAVYLSGAVIENYFAPSLRSGGPGTLGAWSDESWRNSLRRARTLKASPSAR